MNIPGLSEETLQAHAAPGSVERGREYFRSGAVRSLRRRSAEEVEAYVQGTAPAPYHVEIRHDASGVTSARCSCPYVEGPWCRHIAATLLAVLASRGTLSRPLSEMLEAFDRTDLVRLVERLVEDCPAAAARVEDAFHAIRAR